MYQDYEAQNYYATDDKYRPFEGYNPRLGFVRKVYGIISCQLLVTTIFTILCQGPLRPYLYDPNNPTGHSGAFALYILALVVYLITAIAIGCYPKVARSVPTNYILLSLLTVAISYIVGYFTVFFTPSDVILAAVLTLTITIVLTIYAFTTKKDITLYGAALWIAGWALLAFSLLFFFIGPRNAAYGPLVIVFSVIAVIIYGLYLVYDTQLMMGGKRYELSLDDYIIGAVMIYIDIIVIFLRVLTIIGQLRR
jgi:FtsH-binding integral membrane protein